MIHWFGPSGSSVITGTSLKVTVCWLPVTITSSCEVCTITSLSSTGSSCKLLASATDLTFLAVGL